MIGRGCTNSNVLSRAVLTVEVRSHQPAVVAGLHVPGVLYGSPAYMRQRWTLRAVSMSISCPMPCAWRRAERLLRSVCCLITCTARSLPSRRPWSCSLRGLPREFRSEPVYRGRATGFCDPGCPSRDRSAPSRKVRLAGLSVNMSAGKHLFPSRTQQLSQRCR